MTSVGASRGLMGLVGFLIVLGLRYKPVLPREFVRSLVKGALWLLWRDWWRTRISTTPRPPAGFSVVWAWVWSSSPPRRPCLLATDASLAAPGWWRLPS